MIKITNAAAEAIQTVPRYKLIAYFGGWFHIVRLEFPVRPLCGRPTQSKETEFIPASPGRRPKNDRFLCDECYEEFQARHKQTT